MWVEVKGEQGLRKLPEEGLEDDCWQMQLIVLVEVHRQPHVVLLLHFPYHLGVGRPPENPLSGESWEIVGPDESQSSVAMCRLLNPFFGLGFQSGSGWVLMHAGPLSPGVRADGQVLTVGL